MKSRHYQPIVAAITAAFPRFTSKRRLLALTPPTRILRGLYLEPSSAAGESYVWAFVQPLYVPATTIVFSLGKRLGRGRTWRADDTATLIDSIRSEGLPFIMNKETPEELVSWEQTNRRDANSIEVKVYSLAACGRFADAVPLLDELVWMFDEQIPWQRDKKKKLQTLKALCSSDADRAREMLDADERSTRAALSL